ncbi:MAG: hypothetical protein LC122_13475 [Chitinophagales bacterium]|nr:hypothetical protein [Chitinophagales bacterium]
MSLITILYKLASIKSDLINKFPEYKNEIEILSNRDPSKKDKYLTYATKQLVSGQALINEISDVINLFHKHVNRLDEKDINKWNFTELRDKLFELDNIKSKTKTKNEIKTSGGEKIFEDNQCIVLRIITKAAACFYGSGTRWCVTMENQNYFEDYSANNVVLYFILRKDLNIDNPLYKIACSIQRDLNNKVLKVDFFDALDKIGNETYLDNLTNKYIILEKIFNNLKTVPKSFLTKLKSEPELLSEDEINKNLIHKENRKSLLNDFNTPEHIRQKIKLNYDDIKEDENYEHFSVNYDIITEIKEKIQINDMEGLANIFNVGHNFGAVGASRYVYKILNNNQKNIFYSYLNSEGISNFLNDYNKRTNEYYSADIPLTKEDFDIFLDKAVKEEDRALINSLIKKETFRADDFVKKLIKIVKEKGLAYNNVSKILHNTSSKELLIELYKQYGDVITYNDELKLLRNKIFEARNIEREKQYENY